MDWTQTGVERTDQLFTASNSTGLIDTGVLDVRQYSSYYFAGRVLLLGAGTKYNLFVVSFHWSPTVIISDTVYTERYGFFARSNSGTFITFGGKFEAQDQMHAPFVQVTVTTPIASDAVGQGVYSFNGTTRQISVPSIREVAPLGLDEDSDDNWIIHPKNAGALLVNQPAASTVTIPGLMRYSAARWRLLAQNTFNMFGQVPNSDGTVTQTIESFGAAPAVSTTYTNATPLYMPHFPTIWSVTNSSAGQESNQFSIISEEVRSR